MPETLVFKGRGKWTDRLLNAETYNDKTSWNVSFYPDQEHIDTLYTLQSQGVKNVIKRDEDGFNVKYSRPVQKLMKGVMKGFTPVIVQGPEGQPITSFEAVPGYDRTNLYPMEVELYVYEHNVPGSTKKAKAVRLERAKFLSFEGSQSVAFAQKDVG